MKLDMLLSLTQDVIHCGPLPLQQILEDSLFYPASGIDGTPIRHWQEGILSFVYVDTSYSKAAFENVIQSAPPSGYSVYASRGLSPLELTPRGWTPTIPAELDHERYLAAMDSVGASPATAFASRTVFERNSVLSDSHGPLRFSLLFIRAEAVAAYQAIYVSNKIRPKMFAILRPGVGFGGNFSNFDDVLLSVMKTNLAGMPPWLMQWHNKENSEDLPDEPWRSACGRKTDGPLSKDNDRGFKVSIYPLAS